MHKGYPGIPAAGIEFDHTFPPCETMPRLGRHIQACAMDLVTAVHHFIAPVLTGVTLVVM